MRYIQQRNTGWCIGNHIAIPTIMHCDYLCQPRIINHYNCNSPDIAGTATFWLLKGPVWPAGAAAFSSRT